MKEQALQLGAARNLFGILSLPAEKDAKRPVILIPNTGLDPRCGPNRLHVDLARGLAGAGYAVLRLDLGGLGDSDILPGSQPDSVQDLKQAMDELQQRGLATRFVIAGLCSGAHDAHQAALADTRVAGAVFLDGYAYPTPRFRWHWLWQRVLESHRVRHALSRLGKRKEASGAALNLFQKPSLEQARADYAQMMQRGLALAFVYTGQVQYEFNHEGQLWAMFPQLRGYARLQYRYMIHADHIFSRRTQRTELLNLLSDWLKQNF